MLARVLNDCLFVGKSLPDAFQMHRTNLHNVPRLFALENAVATSPRHAGDIEQLRTVNHVIILSSRHANAFSLDLKAQAALVFPQSRGDSRLHAWRCNLTTGVWDVLLELRLTSLSRLSRSAHCR